jgi:glycine oxidase
VHLNAVLRAADVYIVPRQDGSLIIGATVEDAGFDRTVRGEATAWLLEEAARLWEPISGVRSEHIEEVWTGIRPGTPDRLPVLGRLRHPHVWFATGHFRNGILLAPASARVIREMVCGEAVAVDTGPFDPGRFGNASCADAEIYATMTTG